MLGRAAQGDLMNTAKQEVELLLKKLPEVLCVLCICCTIVMVGGCSAFSQPFQQQAIEIRIRDEKIRYDLIASGVVHPGISMKNVRELIGEPRRSFLSRQATTRRVWWEYGFTMTNSSVSLVFENQELVKIQHCPNKAGDLLGKPVYYNEPVTEVRTRLGNPDEIYDGQHLFRAISPFEFGAGSGDARGTQYWIYQSYLLMIQAQEGIPTVLSKHKCLEGPAPENELLRTIYSWDPVTKTIKRVR